MEHYVTLFDAKFAPQGIALHRSLQRHAGEHTLWVLCIDEAAVNLLHELELPDVRTIRLADIETNELVRVRAGRTRAEYCWTLTPFTHDLVFARAPDAERVTYIDADVWLRDDPSPIFSDFDASGAAVQITEHAYAPEHDQTATSGKYCVQFVTMDRERSAPVRRWWQERCLEWCFARFEDGKFGDQKYLDDWPQRFADLVHVAVPRGRFQGPWNAIRYPYSESITYHFHGLHFADELSVVVASARYAIPDPHRRYVYEAYLHDLAAAMTLISETATKTPLVSSVNAHQTLRGRVKNVMRRVRRRLLRNSPTDVQSELKVMQLPDAEEP